jgi:preprotein translocase subunit SecD
VGVVLLATILSLPNLFGDDEALHVSRADGEPMDQAALAQVTAALMGLAYDSAVIEENLVVVRLPTAEEQLRAADAVRKAMPNNVVALTLETRTPGFLQAVGLKPMALGLDLRGGVHFLFQVDLNSAVRQYLETYETDLRRQLREADIRNGLEVRGDALEVTVADAADAPRAEQIIRRLDAATQLLQLGQATSRLIIEPEEIGGRSGFRVRLTEAAIRERQDFAIQQNTLTLRNRVNQLGVAEAVVQRQGLDRILVQLPGVQDPSEAERILGSTATLQFRLTDLENSPIEAEARKRAPLGSELSSYRGAPILLRREVIASGDQLIDAQFRYMQGQPGVHVRLDSTASKKMLDTTIANVGKNIAVLYIEDKPQLVERDGKLVPGPPKRDQRVIFDGLIKGVFSDQFEISGLTPFEGQDLALLLRAGSLAAPIVKVEQKTIGPSLGQDNIDRGIRATIVGYLLVVAFIGLYYRVFGMLANIALGANVVMLIALMSLFGFQLSLPGIAGIVLTVGMAVDANVLIFERIREELANGNTPQNSIRAGFDKAYSTIVDSNLTTVIAALVLFFFGTGPIKGFAITLTLGIATSMFTAITVTRALVNAVYGSRPHVKSLSIGGRPPPAPAKPAHAR